MIDIFCTGASFYGVKLSYAAMEIIMREDFVKDQDFIEFVFENGTKGAIRKGTVLPNTRRAGIKIYGGKHDGMVKDNFREGSDHRREAGR